MRKLKLPVIIYELKPYIYIFLAMIIWLANMEYFPYWLLSAILFFTAYKIIIKRREYRYNTNFTTTRPDMDIQLTDSNKNIFSIHHDTFPSTNGENPLDLDSFKQNIILNIKEGDKNLNINFNDWCVFSNYIITWYSRLDLFKIETGHFVNNLIFSKDSHNSIQISTVDGEIFRIHFADFEEVLDILESTIDAAFSYKCANKIRLIATLKDKKRR